MTLDIRPARASDLDALVAVEDAVFAEDRISRRAFRGLIASRSAEVLVAEEAGRVVGCCVVLSRAGSRRARLYSIAAAPGRSGVGRPLLAAAERAAAAGGAATLRLEVREDNLRAVRLYEASGYRPFGRFDGYYADGAPALRFEKPLAEVAHASPAPPGASAPPPA
jgi:ribosomal protein S18 acetylase RimI-like enzyme